MSGGTVSKRSRSGVVTALALLVLPLPAAWLTALLHPRRPDWEALRAVSTGPEISRLTVAEAREKHPDALWLDAREAAAFAAGHVPGALSFTEAGWEEAFPALMDHWDGRRTIIVYCGGETCDASEAVARRLRLELGFSDVLVLAGGWEAWRAAGFPVEGAP